MSGDRQTGMESVGQVQKPGYALASIGTGIWVAAIVALWLIDQHAAATAVAVVALLIVLVSVVYRPLRSRMSGGWVAFVPVDGLIARGNQIRTCEKLRRAGIYRPDKPTDTIPAHTSHKRGETIVQFDGSGEAGMSPDHLAKILTENARVWGARSFAIVEDDARPGRYTVTLYKSAVAPSALDDAIVGVVS